MRARDSILRGRSLMVSLATAAILLVLLTSWYRREGAGVLINPHLTILLPRDKAANSTLGFEKLLVVSPRPSWRTRGLEAAAQLTGLNFTIPPQPKIVDEFVRAFQSLGAEEGKKTPQFGSAKAWLAHLDLIRHVITSRAKTAFIVEDDVDWDIRLKDQIRLISDNVRNYTSTPDHDESPYGSRWDVLWLGHCGSIIRDPMPPPLIYGDDSRCKTELYSGWSKDFLRKNLPEGKRQVQESLLTVCTFGYGITESSAQKILELTSKGGDEAFDVSLSNHCQSGALRCIVVNPQVFNHYEPPAGQGYNSEVHVGDGQDGSSDDSVFDRVKGTTGNIMESARCSVLFQDTCMRPPSEI